jgi:hypothetical protein
MTLLLLLLLLIAVLLEQATAHSVRYLLQNGLQRVSHNTQKQQLATTAT